MLAAGDRERLEATARRRLGRRTMRNRPTPAPTAPSERRAARRQRRVASTAPRAVRLRRRSSAAHADPYAGIGSSASAP